jgi:MarR family transcriptional regulator, negative regulator of the multidrug operon emrRAB
MIEAQTENVTGALAVALADAVYSQAEQLAPDVGPTVAVLTLLAHEPGLSIDRIRKTMHLSHPGAVRLVDRLVARGFVERRQATRDRREVAVHLTEVGERTAQDILEARQKRLSTALSVLSSSEREVFGKLAERILRAFVRNEDHAFEICRYCNDCACQDCPVAEELESR